MEWQPIATAPRDGSRILISNHIWVFGATWAEFEGEMAWVILDDNGNLDSFADNQSLAWSPMPSAPSPWNTP